MYVAPQGSPVAQAAGWRMSTLPPMEDDQFARWVALLEQRTGMCLPVERKSFLVTSLAIRMREVGYTDYQHYYELVTSADGIVEWSILVDRLTVHETRFFRHPASLRLVRDLVLPRPHELTEGISINVWSAGCATGEEAYTLAMLIDHYLASHQVKYYIGISATDISLASLAAGRRAIYHRRKMSGVPAYFLQEYFTAIDDEHYQVHRRLRERVCFTRMSVLEKQRALGQMDIIFCQNVLIYFDGKRRIEILNNLADSLKLGGVLVLGPGEILNWRRPDIEMVRYENTLAYRRTSLSSASVLGANDAGNKPTTYGYIQ